MGDIDFINFNEDTINNYTDVIKMKYKKTYDSIANLITYKDILVNLSKPLTYKSVIAVINDLYIDTRIYMAMILSAGLFHVKYRIRDKCNQAYNIIDNYITHCQQRKDVYMVFSKYYDNYYPKEKQNLTLEQQIYTESLYNSYKNSGFALPDHEFKEVIELKNKIGKLSNKALFKLHGANSDDVFSELIFNRDKLARKLGKKNFADYKNGAMMEHVNDFLNGIDFKYSKIYLEEFSKVTEFAQNHLKDPNFKLRESYEENKYVQFYARQKFGIDLDKLAKSFPLRTVLNGMLRIFGKLLQFRFEEVLTNNKYHDTVRVFDVYSEDILQGRIYFDLVNRKDKGDYAGIIQMRSTCSRKISINYIYGCFDREGLLFKNIIDLFHEFGHCVHNICCKNSIDILNGSSGKLTFIETPSQLFELWCFDKEILNELSCDKVDDDLLTGMIKYEKYTMMLNIAFQTVLSRFDLSIHSKNFDNVADVNWKKIYQDEQGMILGYKAVKNYCIDHSASSNYSANYFSYLLCMFSAHNMFAKFDGKLMDPIIGAEYKKKVLEPGDITCKVDLINEFLNIKGRNENIDETIHAFFKI